MKEKEFVLDEKISKGYFYMGISSLHVKEFIQRNLEKAIHINGVAMIKVKDLIDSAGKELVE